MLFNNISEPEYMQNLKQRNTIHTLNQSISNIVDYKHWINDFYDSPVSGKKIYSNTDPNSNEFELEFQENGITLADNGSGIGVGFEYLASFTTTRNGDYNISVFLPEYFKIEDKGKYEYKFQWATTKQRLFRRRQGEFLSENYFIEANSLLRMSIIFTFVNFSDQIPKDQVSSFVYPYTNDDLLHALDSNSNNTKSIGLNIWCLN